MFINLFLFFENDWMVYVLPENNAKVADDKKTVPSYTKDYVERERQRERESNRKMREMKDKQKEGKIE